MMTEKLNKADLGEVDEIRLWASREATRMYRLSGVLERRGGAPEAITLCREAGRDGQRLARACASMLRRTEL